MQILEVNNKSFEQTTHSDALQVLRGNTHLAITVRFNILGIYRYYILLSIATTAVSFRFYALQHVMLRTSKPSSRRSSVRPFVRHTLELYQDSASYDHEIFTVGCHKDSSFS